MAFVPAAISVVLVGFVRERPGSGMQQGSGRREITRLGGRYWRLIAVLGVFGLVNFSDALLILRAKSLGLGFVGVVLAYAAYNLSYAVLSYPAGALSDRVPRRLVFATGLAVFAVAYVGLGVARSSVWVWVLFPLYGGYTALTDGVGKAWVADLLPPARVGGGLGLYQCVSGGAALVAGVWAGLAWGGDGKVPLLVSGAVAACVAFALIVAGRRFDPESRP